MEKGETFLKITGSNELPQLGNLVTWRTTKSALSNLLKSKIQEVEKVQQNQVFVPGKPEPQSFRCEDQPHIQNSVVHVEEGDIVELLPQDQEKPC